MQHVIDLDDVVGLGEDALAAVGGKAASLGALRHVPDLRVPDGFCVTTAAFAAVVEAAPGFADALVTLATVDDGDRAGLRAAAARIAGIVEAVAFPATLTRDVDAALARHGVDARYAVRSSATAEDLPSASFAGQHDSHLDVAAADVALFVRRCWASLFTERAVSYRREHGLDHGRVRMAVVVQRMVAADAAGVLFTADPVSGDRTVASVEAVPGLGEDLVSGRVTPDTYRVRAGEVTAVVRGEQPVLTDDEVRGLVALGRRLQAHTGRPQDVEWCRDTDGFSVVQSRPITTLFPVPVETDGENHVYVSVGHQQMMTDAFKALGLSLWHLTTSAVMTEAGNRLFVDVTARLGTPSGRAGLLAVMAADPLTHDAVRTVAGREGFVRERPDPAPPARPAGAPGATPDPEAIDELIAENEASLAALERELASLSGPALFDALPAAFAEDKRLLFDPRGIALIMAGMDASTWLNEHLLEWLGERNVADTLTLSAPHNVTSQLGLALLDVADVVRPHPAVVAHLRQVVEGGDDADFLDTVAALPGGAPARRAFEDFLARYGARGPGEIDLTRPRWAEQPAALAPAVLSNALTAAPGEATRRFDDGRRRAQAAAAEVVARVRELPDGERKAREVRQMIDRVRTFTGYREYPKFNRVRRLWVYKQALLREADALVAAGLLRERDDVFHLRFEELERAVRTRELDPALLPRRREEFAVAAGLTPPRVLTSDGEAVVGAYRRDDVPPGALPGLAVSAGVVEGRARVVLDPDRAELAAGDILVTRFTDPGWTPLFVAASGLVTEIGGLMTHGAVIAREYGLPAVVGVADATGLIADGARIRVDARTGFVEILD